MFFGKYVGVDDYGNKYYKSKKNERWVVYSDNIEASKITSEWYLWMHLIASPNTNLHLSLIKSIVVNELPIHQYVDDPNNTIIHNHIGDKYKSFA